MHSGWRWAIRLLDRQEPEPPLLFWGSIEFVILFAPITSRVMHAIIDGGRVPYWVIVGPLEEITRLLPLLLPAWLVPGVVNSLRDGIVHGHSAARGLVNVSLWPVLAWGVRRSGAIEGGA